MKLSKKEDFSILFDKHYNRLFSYALKVVGDKDTSSELVQETLIILWNKINTIKNDDRSMEAFLIVTLKNKIIDHHRKNQVRDKHINLYTLNKGFQVEMENEWELIKKIDSIYASLNSKTTEIFKLSRDKGHTYKEIANLKNISIKTVEFHISKALIAFKKGLKDYL